MRLEENEIDALIEEGAIWYKYAFKDPDTGKGFECGIMFEDVDEEYRDKIGLLVLQMKLALQLHTAEFMDKELK